LFRAPLGARGKTVAIAGTLHILNVITIDANGIHLLEQFQPNGNCRNWPHDRGQVSRYRHYSLVHPPDSADTFEFTHINRFDIIGQGRASNFTIRETVHTIVLADGTCDVDRR